MAEATAAVEAKQPSTDKARKIAEQHLSSLKKTAILQRTSTMEIGWQARIMKEGSEFSILGMEENDCREQVGIERSTWFRSIQIAEGFKKLKKHEFLKMQSGKAFQLLRLSENDRYKDAWYKRACDPKITEAALTEMIDAKLETGELKADATSVEERVWLKIRLYKASFESVMEKLKVFCHNNGLADDYGEALTQIMSDKADEKLGTAEIGMLRAIRTAMQEKMPELKATVELLKDAKRPAEDRCTAFEKAATSFITELAKAAQFKSKN